MRIGLFTDTYPPNINGVATSVCMLKKALEKKGHQVFLVTVNPDNMKFVYEDNGKTIKLPGLPVGIVCLVYILLELLIKLRNGSLM